MNEYHSFTQLGRADCHENIHTYLLNNDDDDFCITSIYIIVEAWPVIVPLGAHARALKEDSVSLECDLNDKNTVYTFVYACGYIWKVSSLSFRVT